MGEIAEGILDGTFDSLTGEYLGEGQGFPRTRDKEHAKSTGSSYVGRRHEKHNNYNGIVNYIQKHYKENLPNIPLKKHGAWLKWFHSIIREFLRENNIDHINNNKYGVVFSNARKAQKDWDKFTEFLKNRNWE